MTTEDRAFIGLGVGLVLVVLVMGCVIVWVQSEQCEQTWRNSGLRSEWRLMTGCLVQQTDKTWIPEKNYRVID